MDRNEVYASDAVTALTVRLGWASLDVISADVDAIQVFLSGAESGVSDIRMMLEDTTLKIEQPTYGIGRHINNDNWLQMIIRVPREWKGAVDCVTVSGSLSLRGLTGTDMKAETVTGHLRLNDLECITLRLKNISGDISGDSLYGEQINLQSVSGRIALSDTAFVRIRLSQVSGETAMLLTAPFEDMEGKTISGNVSIAVPMEAVDARLHTVSGRIRTDHIFLTDDAPRLAITSVSAALEISGRV